MKERTGHKRRMFRMNNNLLFILVVLLLALNSYTFMITSSEYLTGKVSVRGVTRICIGIAVTMTNPAPGIGDVIMGNYTTNVTSNTTSYVNFYYYRMPQAEQFFGVDYDVDDDTIFNATLETGTLPEGNCRYRIIARGYATCGTEKVGGSGVFTVNNIDQAPIWTKFNNSHTTNFSAMTSWVDAPSSRIVEPRYGMIQPQVRNYDGADLDTLFNISYNLITLNTSIDYNCFDDVLYRITFFNVTQFAEPVVIKNGGPCGGYCFDFAYSNGNYSFGTRVSGYAEFSIAEGGDLKINKSAINKTFDNSPTLRISTYMQGSVQNLSMPAECYYMTDYNPTTFTLMNVTRAVDHVQVLEEHNWSYIPTGMGHYSQIQNYDFYAGEHIITFNCSVMYQDVVDNEKTRVENVSFLIMFTDRDRVFYVDGDEVKLYLVLEESGLNISVDFSDLDSNFNPDDVVVINNGFEYNISYNISSTNTMPDGQHNVTIEAINDSGYETMNGSIIINLHNTWLRSDVDDAFDCWSFKPGYYFDEDSCDWDSDVNMAAKRQIDPLFTEISCFDSLDNDGDGTIDINDSDCAGIYYSLRNLLGIDSAFFTDPCSANVCYMCLGTDDNGDGLCDQSDGVNVRYLHSVQPDAPIRVTFARSAYINNLPVRVSLNFLNTSFGVRPETSYIRQLPYKELGGCSGGTNCRSVTGTSYDSGTFTEFNFTGYLDEKVTTIIGNTSPIGAHPYLAAGRSIGGSSIFQNMIFFGVNGSAILNESDIPSYCFDGVDNDLNDYYDCYDRTCNLTENPSNPNQRCEWGIELTCDDGYDNDWDGYTDCQDNDCFKKNGTSGPCYAIEDFNATSCSDSVNNDYDYGIRCNNTLSTSYQNRSIFGATLALTDCLDYDCDGELGNVALAATCEYCTELTCDDGFNNDADSYYDCTGNAYRSNYERDCDRWNDPSSPLAPQCPLVELNCTDEIDNDLDSDSPNGEYSWLGTPVYGGWDCQDIDCADEIGDNATGALCQYGNESACDDGFDNDGDGYTDCDDPSTCKGLSGMDQNLTGLCRPCAAIENITIDSCRDSDDNDYDGLVDCADVNCSGLPSAGVGRCGLTEQNCTDGIDNDYDWLIDVNDTDCVVIEYTSDEFGPGQCNDGRDNDDDGDADCSDSDCAGSLICTVGSFDYDTCSYVATLGVISVCETKFVRAGGNFTLGFSHSSLNVGSVMFILGNAAYSLKSITPVLNTTTSFMTGTTTNFVLLRGSYGLLAQNSLGFSGALDLRLIATTDASLTPGDYYNYILSSVEGSLDDIVTPVYIAENEPPIIHNITSEEGHMDLGGGGVDVTFAVNTTDNQTYNSGISFCTMELPGYFLVNSSSCTYSANLTSGTYNVSAIAYDGALNPSTLYSQEFNLSIWTYPVQTGDFYNPYPANNYPNKTFFNNTESLNVGVNFEGGSGFTADPAGCSVEIMNSTHVVHTDTVDLSVVAAEAHCNGQVDLGPLTVAANISNLTGFPSAVYYFRVGVTDTASRSGVSEVQDFNYCYYYWDESSGKYRCMDRCVEQGIANAPPVLMVPIPNQSWPRGTSLTSIDLDEYFMDPNGDPLNFSWYIDTDRIEVEIDANNIVTFTPDSTYYGLATIVFYAHDYVTFTPSNTVYLDVVFQQLPSIVIPSAGGGGGGAARNLSQEEPPCEEDWTCTDWGPCLPTGYQTRNCRDRNECGSTDDMPDTIRECLYRPTCKDRIRNGDEEGIDCGGACPPCPSCRDGIINMQEEKIDQILSADPEDVSDCGGPFCPVCPTCGDNAQNQGEEGIDCGGPCSSCATCFDGKRNQGEVNVDCGGPCAPCGVKVTEVAFNWNLVLLVISLFMLLGLFLLALLFGVFKRKFIRFKAKLLNYYMRSIRMFDRKKLVEKELPILQWVNAHLDSIEESIPSKNVEQSINAIDRLVRIFFKRVFLIRYAFTHDELVKELEKQRMPLVLKKAADLLFEELSQIKYGGESIEKDAVKTLVGQVKVITERIVNEIEVKKKIKVKISERDIAKIEQTLSGAHHLSVKEAVKKMKK